MFNRVYIFAEINQSSCTYFQMTKWSLFGNEGGGAGYEKKKIATLLKVIRSIVCKCGSLDHCSNNVTPRWSLSVLWWKLVDSEEWGCGWIAPLNNFPFPRSWFLTLLAHLWPVHRQQSYNTLSNESVSSFASSLEFSNLSVVVQPNSKSRLSAEGCLR